MRATGLVLLILGLSVPAFADVPQPLPTDCAQGSVPQSSRQGAWCEPTRCESDAECPAYAYCATERSPCPAPERYRCSAEPMGLCVVSGPISVTSGACSSDADCPVPGARCERARRCVHGPERSGIAAIRSGCGCRAGGGRGGSFGLVLAALGLWLVRRSRS